MAKKINPFRPGQIAVPGMFAGRYEELLALERFLLQTKSGNPHHFLIHGERGIGKSSLLLYLEHMARGSFESIESGTFRFLPITVELDRTTAFMDIVKKIGREFQRSLAPYQKAKEILKTTWDFVTRFEALGVKYDSRHPPQAPDRDEIIEKTIAAVGQACSAMGSEIDGVLLLMDEADKPAPEAELGIFVKLLTERLTKRGATNVVLGLSGLPPLVAKLRKSHESAPRIFEMIALEPLTVDERVSVVRKGLEAAEKAGGPRVTISQSAETMISNFSEGYPHFIQQFAYSSFDADSDGAIDDADVLRGVMGPNGGIHQLGLKYFEALYFDQIGSDEYREVLRAMSEDFTGWVTKEQLRKRTQLKAHTVNNAVAALKKRNIIVAKPGQPGVYRLPTGSFAVWIRAFTSASSGKIGGS